MNLDFKKEDGLVQAILQDELTLDVLMTGYMNEEALFQTQQQGEVIFFSRKKNLLWKKGEISGVFMLVKDLQIDCHKNTILIKVKQQRLFPDFSEI